MVVASAQLAVGRSRRQAHPSKPVKTGALPTATSVPSGTPARATPAKKKGWYAAAPTAARMPARLRQGRTMEPTVPPRTNTKTLRARAPMVSRMAPTVSGWAPAGAKAEATPAVPNSMPPSRTEPVAALAIGG